MIGARFGRYQVLRQIAGGVANKVFLASDGAGVYAVKVFAPSFERRAQREFAFGSDLEHPRLNRIEAMVEVEGRAAVLMPFVPGVQLWRWLPIHGDRAAVVRLVVEVLDALAYLHGRGIVHRDVKPENILVGRDDQPTLIDFDLAARVGEGVGERGWAGTAAYLSPEGVRGEPASPADDLYSVGVTLYWGLTGTLPFDGSLAEVLAAHGSEEPVRPSRHDRELAAFDPWMTRALAKRAADRFPSATAMKTALASIATPGA